MLLKKYIKEVIKKESRNYLFEKAPHNIKMHFGSKKELNAHLIIIPDIVNYDVDDPDSLSRLEKFYNDVTVENGIKLADGYTHKPWSFVIQKTQQNIEKLVKLIEDNPNLDGLSSIEKIDSNYLKRTIKDDLPVFIRVGPGNFFSNKGQKPRIINLEDNPDIIQWSIHDLYHEHESSAEPDGWRSNEKEGFVKMQMLSNLNSKDVDKKIKLLNDYFGIETKDIKEAENNICEFLNKEGFTKGVITLDVYPSIFSYVIMNIESTEDIKNLKGLGDNEKKILLFVFLLTRHYDNWLSESKNKNKIFICTADHRADISYT